MGRFSICRHLAPVLALSLALAPLPAAAQTIREDVQQHVEESLEKEKKKKGKKKKHKHKYKHKHEDKGHEGGGVQPAPGPDGTVEAAVEVEPAEQGPKLPLRVIHKNFQLDLIAGVNYRGWLPQQYPTVAVDMAHYFTWSVAFKLRLFQFLSIRRGYYESNAAVAPRKSYLASAAKYGKYGAKAAWFLAEIGFPIAKAFEPVLRYEARVFETKAHVKGGHLVCVVPFNSDADVEGCVPTADPLMVVSSYETAVIGLRYHHSKNASGVIHAPESKVPPFFVGAAYLSYLKPYQVTVGSSVLDEYLFTGRFYGGGLAFGTEIGGGVNNIYLDIWTQFGLGVVQLTRDMSLNELAPEDWLIGYIQGNVKLEYRWALWKFPPTFMIVPSVTLSGASFFFFETSTDEGEEVATPPVNWDLLWTVGVSFILTL